MSTDLADAMLGLVVRTLPDQQAEWGEAMRAELAAITVPARRRRFAGGCALAVLRRPAGALTVSRWLAAAALLVAAAALAWAIGVPRVRAEALGVVAGLALAHGLLRSRIGFGPVAATCGARLAAAAGTLAVAAQVMLEFRQLRVDPPLMLPMDATVGIYDAGRATAQLIVTAVVLGVLLAALTRVTAGRSAVRPVTIATGAGAAAVSSMVWLAVVLLHPAASTVAGPALAAVVAAGLLAGARVAGLARSAGEEIARIYTRQGLVAALLAAAATTTAIGVLMDLLPLTGHWVANNAAPVFAPQSPTRIVDSVVVWFPGLVFMFTLILTVRRCARTPAQQSTARE